MKRNNLNKPIIFIDKKNKIKNNHKISDLKLNKLNNNEIHKIIGYENHKKSKIKKAKQEAIKQSSLYKHRKMILVFFLIILGMYLVPFLWHTLQESSSIKSSNKEFKIENQYLSDSDTLTYTNIIEDCLRETLGINYEINTSQLHKNGDLIFANGFFKVPNKGIVNFDIIIKNHSPYSLKVNGKEFIK